MSAGRDIAAGRCSTSCADPATHGGAQVMRIDTHAATVFLAGERALKIKRAVRFPFLDYSTLEKRKAACEAEIEVNRAYAPAIYRGVRGDHARGRRQPRASAATASRSNGRSRCAASTRRRRSIIWPTAASIDEALADALGRAVAAAHATAPVGRAGGLHRRSWPRSSSRTTPSCARRPSCFLPPRSPRSTAGDARRARARAAAAGRARARRTGAALPRRSASRQYRADRRRAGAVRRHRIRSA